MGSSGVFCRAVALAICDNNDDVDDNDNDASVAPAFFVELEL